jgi:hypothetical protein
MKPCAQCEACRCAASDALDLSGVDAGLAAHLCAAQKRFGAAALGVIDLPPLGQEPIIGPQVRIAAVLYFERELERSGLVPFVEALAAGLADGRLPLPLGRSVHRLAAIARGSDSRMVAPERDRIYRQVFEAGALDAHDPFDQRLATLARALSEIGRAEPRRGVADLIARVGVLATEIGETLSQRTQGMAAFAAREIAAEIREALELLSDAEVARALGGGSPWSILMRHGSLWLGRQLNSGKRVSRARSGFEMLDWIGASAADLTGAARLLDGSHRLISAAETWLAEGGGA